MKLLAKNSKMKLFAKVVKLSAVNYFWKMPGLGYFTGF